MIIDLQTWKCVAEVVDTLICSSGSSSGSSSSSSNSCLNL